MELQRVQLPVATALCTAAVLCGAVTLIGPAAPVAAGPGCDLVAAPRGSDAAGGTTERPLRTAQALAASLAAGETGCLQNGIYDDDPELKLTAEGSTLRSYPGERATLRTRIWVVADDVTVSGLDLDGSTARRCAPGGSCEILPSPTVTGDRAVFRDNEVTNRRRAICFLIGNSDYGVPHGVRIVSNRIHDCGRRPAVNFDHGIYVADAVGTVIRDNWIYDNGDRGVQLYPNARNTLVAGNVIDGNGEGVSFGGDGLTASSGNVVAHNVIANSRLRFNIEYWWGDGPVGRGNVVRDNCLWNGAQGNVQTPVEGLRIGRNILANPLYVDPEGGVFDLVAGSACAAVLARGVGERSSQPGPRRRVSLRAARHVVRSHRTLRLRGRVSSRGSPARHALVQRWGGGRWRRIRSPRIDARGRFAMRVASGRGPRGLVFRAWAPRAGRSRALRVWVRRPSVGDSMWSAAAAFAVR